MKVLTGPVQPCCSTRLVSRGEVAADPSALQLQPNTHAVALRLLQPAGVEVSQLWVPERMPGKKESRVSFVRKLCCDLWQLVCGVPSIFSPLVFQSPNPLRVIT